MKIGLIGAGYVGSAISWAHRHNEVIIRDPKLKDSASLEAIAECDGIYVCVPSPSLEDGHCDTRILESVIEDLDFIGATGVPIISKVTAPPTVYAKLKEKRANLVYCPEFLTAANNIADYQNAEYFVLGGEKYWCERAREVIREGVPMVSEKFLFTDIKSASMFKYMMNSYLATKVTFMNDFKELADAVGVDWKALSNLSVFDDRIGYTHMSVPGPDGQYGWGGACFPKDVAAIIEEGIDLGCDMELLQRVETLNKRHRGQ